MKPDTSILDSTAADPDAISFPADATAVLTRVRNAFSGLLASLPEARRPADLQRVLKIDYKLSWRAHKIATAAEPLSIGPHVPGRASLNRFLTHAASRGLPSVLIETTRQAGRDFESLVRRHATDRSSFDSMMSAISGSENDQLDLEHKRAAFRAACHLYGLRTETELVCKIINGGRDKDRVDVCRIQGYLGLQRSRPDAPLMLSRHAFKSDYGAIEESFSREPLDPTGNGDHGVALLPQFCSQPVPEIRISELSSAEIQADLVGREVGTAGRVTCVLADIGRNLLSPYSDDTLPRLRSNPVIRVPSEVLIHDFLIPSDLYGPVMPRLLMLTEERMLDLSPGHEEPGLLPIKESVIHLGRGLEVIHTPDVPRYGQLLHHTFDHLGWDPERFEVFRCRIEYPVMHSVASIQFYLPDEPPEVTE